jgi:hypothetical protein
MLNAHHLIPTTLKFIRHLLDADAIALLPKAVAHGINIRGELRPERQERKHPDL